MSDHTDFLLTHAPDTIKSDLVRLLEISPLFTSLLRGIDAEECSQLFREVGEAQLPDGSNFWIPDCDSLEVTQCMQHLRRCKQRGMRHLIWWELGLQGDIDASYRAIADFGAGLMQQALNMAESLLAGRYGRVEQGRFCIIGLGKMGGRELNLGSDIDPLMVWEGGGSSSGGRTSVPAKEYYGHLARMVIRLLDERTSDGQVWPIDMRLRPGGDGSAITLSLNASVAHFQEYGQTWERAMLIKARPIAGDLSLGETFIEELGSFIYRRYLDYTTVAALADMKVRIDRQAGVRGIGVGYDVKRGKGGIREIEFVIQSLQLIHGGRNRKLRTQPSMDALAALTEAGVIDREEAEALRAAYLFWRRIEHAIQARRGEQTQKLPEGYAVYLERATGIASIDQAMAHHAAEVEQSFSRQILPVGEAPKDESCCWLGGSAETLLPEENEDDRRRMLLALEKLDGSLSRGLLPERSRRQVERILAQAMPKWLDDENGVTALEAFAELVRSISGRATWIDLLATHQGVLDWLIGALSASRYLADHIVRDPSWLEWPLATEHNASDIRQLCAALENLGEIGDVEQELADLGRWVDRARLLAALAVDAHTAGPMEVGGWLADMADAATAAVLKLCCRQMKLPEDFPVVALALGKHGSREMGLVSDLDMVFVLVHDAPEAMIGSRSAWDHAQRIGRRAIQYLTAAPPFGAGFEFDARLRPSGSSGVLVTTLSGFHDYQLSEAQTWEHQALCRARAAAGPDEARQQVERVVAEILDKPRELKALASDVLGMRQKMVEHLASTSDSVINLKQDEGGLVDIEFLAQYSRLAFGGEGRRTSDILKGIPEDAPAAWRENAGWLAATYLDYRQMENALRVELWRSIGKLPDDPAATEWETMRRHAAITSPDALKARMQKVRSTYNRLITV